MGEVTLKAKKLSLWIALILIVGAGLTFFVAFYTWMNGGFSTDGLKIVTGILAAGVIRSGEQALRHFLNPTRSQRTFPKISMISIVTITTVCVLAPPYLLWMQANNTLQIAFSDFALVLGATQPVFLVYLNHITKVLLPT